MLVAAKALVGRISITMPPPAPSLHPGVNVTSVRYNTGTE